MLIEKTDLADVLVLVPQPFRDDRGLFTSTFDADIFDDYLGRPGCSASFVQDSQSRSRAGVIRGMHGRSGRGEAKLVRCANGAVHDVLVDIRPESPTFGSKQAFLLDDNDFRHLYVPPGFLHGFQALTATADVCYRIDRPHDPSEDLGVAYHDPDLAIDWPLPVSAVSSRDASAGSWAELLRHLRVTRRIDSSRTPVGAQRLQMRQPGVPLEEVVAGQPRRQVFLVQLGGAVGDRPCRLEAHSCRNRRNPPGRNGDRPPSHR